MFRIRSETRVQHPIGFPALKRLIATVAVLSTVVPDHSVKVRLTVQSDCPDLERAKQWRIRHPAEFTLKLASVM